MEKELLRQQINHLLQKGSDYEDIKTRLNVLTNEQQALLDDCVNTFDTRQQNLKGQHNQALYAMSLQGRAS